MRPWTEKRKNFESFLSSLEHPRVRDLAWSVLGPGICGGQDAKWGQDVCTDERMKMLLGDIRSSLQGLQSNPSALEQWLGSHARAGSRLVGHYYESLLHFAFELSNTVALYSEPIPKDHPPEPDKLLQVRRFKPPLKSAKDVDFFCNIRRAEFLQGRRLQIDFQLKRGKSKDDLPLAAGAVLRSSSRMLPLHSFSPESRPDSPVVDGHVVFDDVEPFEPLEFTYAPGFTAVSLQQSNRAPVQGEVDYVVWPDRKTPRFIHIEAAVKFYLASKEHVAEWDDFIAPNPIDILGVKLRRMLTHQLRMGQTSHIRELLASQVHGAGGDVSSIEISSWLWMNGRLFFHAPGTLAALAALASELHVEAWHEQIAMLSPDLEVGWWCFLHELEATLPDGLSYLILKKPYWLAPLRGSGSRHVDHGQLRSKNKILEQSRKWRSFQYLVVLSYPKEGCSDYEEVCRGFVVPDSWPKKPKRRRSRSSSSSS